MANTDVIDITPTPEAYRKFLQVIIDNSTSQPARHRLGKGRARESERCNRVGEAATLQVNP